MRRTLIVLGGVLAAALVAWGCFALISLMAHERTTTALSFSGVNVVELDLESGGVTLTGAAVAEVSGERVVDRGLRRPSFSERLTNGTLRLHTSCPTFADFHCDVQYHLTVPAGVTVTGSSSGGGITVSDTSGPVTVSSSGGGIEVVRSSGNLELSSSGGGIRVSEGHNAVVKADSSGGGINVTLLDAPDLVDAGSSGGGVRVVLPRDEAFYAVDASSSGGGTSVAVRTDPASPRRIHLRSSGGGVTVRYP